ncbi:hypothetical protein V9T40_012474 [Parthenolecanium corni]|uniref:Gustatory receptor n=1 Tax=Parthenolecanium corni TaxID=536013 RepID=A0AAN9TB66_9HEMI
MPDTLQFSWKDCGSLRSHIPMTSSIFRVIFATILVIFTILYGISAPLYIVQTNLPEWYPKGIFVRKSFFANESTIEPSTDTYQSLIMKILYPILITLASISIRTAAIFSMRKGLKNFFTKIEQADRFLKRMENFENVVNTRSHLLYSVGLCCFFLIMSIPIHFNYLLTAIWLNNRYGLMWCIAMVWSVMTGFCGDILFSFCAYLIRIRFKVINMTLGNIRTDETNFHATFHPTSGYEGIINGSFNHLPKEEINKTYELLKFQINLRRGTMCKYGLADTIEIYRHCHRSLCELVRYLNGMFKLHLLMTLSACFLISLFNIYFAMFGYVATVSKKQSIKIQSKLFRSIGWNMFYIVRFLAMTTTAHFTTQQVSPDNSANAKESGL